MTPDPLPSDTLNFLFSLILPLGCRFSRVSSSTYRIYCSDYDMADQVWHNIHHCLYPLLSQGSIVEVVATDYYARSHPKG